jgi:hypothetical protein
VAADLAGRVLHSWVRNSGIADLLAEKLVQPGSVRTLATVSRQGLNNLFRVFIPEVFAYRIHV